MNPNKPANFIKESLKQLKKTDWPSKEQTIRLTTIVIFCSLLVAAYIGALDYLFTNLIALIIKG